MKNKNICIHGHFYQPPRENPWLEDVELQESAYPYHDWNQRVTAEAYEPNTAARVVDVDSEIVDIVSNYSKISFNFGPTLLSWMEKHQPEVYNAIIKADEESKAHFSGHGAAIAQAYSHMIMPLASSRDKKTQIKWGIRDFQKRFGRDPEGMWLPETAVDKETLSIMASEGIKYTILAPRQAKSVRKLAGGKNKWEELKDGGVDPRRPYLCKLDGGEEIVLFFYDGNVAHDVAFGKVLSSGEQLAKRLMGTLDDGDVPQISHIATDGETFGHHQTYGDMTLAYALSFIDSLEDVSITNYAEFIEKHELEYEVEIHENSSWSCIHGVERWKEDCGCNSGGRPEWNQKWRKPLREALDWLRESLIDVFQTKGKEYFHSPWDAREDYIDVILDRGPESLKSFLSKHAVRSLSEDETVTAIKILEMQRFAMLMYTSCGWFFDELSGIETMQVIQYAARAIQLAEEIDGTDLEKGFIEMLKKAPSNIPEHEDGARLYEKYIQNCRLDLVRVGAHFAISSFFEKYPQKASIYCYETETDKLERQEAGSHNLVCGRARIKSLITTESKQIMFAVMHLGDHNIVGGVTKYEDEKKFISAVKDINTAFARIDMSSTIELIRKYFGEHNYTLWHLFKDEQRKALARILSDPISDIERDMKRFQKQYYPVLKAVQKMHIPLPRQIRGLLELIFNVDLNNLLQKKSIKVQDLDKVLEEVQMWGVDLDVENLAYAVNAKVTALMEKFQKRPHEIERLQKVEQILERVKDLNVDFKLWKAKNIYFLILKELLPGMEKKASSGDTDSARWVELFKSLAGHLNIRI